MAAKVAKVLCKECQVWMPRIDWLTNKTCDNPNCKCPEVQKLIQQTQQVINKASGGKVVDINIHRGAVPHGYNKDAPNGQYVIDVPDVKVIYINPIKRK